MFGPTGSSDDSQRGHIAGLPGAPAFSLEGPAALPIPVVIAVPHAGRSYAPELLHNMRYPDAARLRLEDRLVDNVARLVAAQTGATLLTAHAPRALIDLNRAPDDIDWGMVTGAPKRDMPPLSIGRRARGGLGLVPRRLQGMGEIWKRPLSMADLEDRLAGVHRPYHAALAGAMLQLQDKWGAALLIDMHSMPPLGPVLDNPAEGAAVEFVVGDRFGAACMAALSACAMGALSQQGCNAAYNRPYAGGYVLERHGMPGRGLHAMQLEICRSVYLDDSLRDLGQGLDRVVRVLSALVIRLSQCVTDSREFSQAAE